MRSIYAVFKREVKAYFTLPIAYVMMGGLLFIVGLLYWMSFRWFLGVSFESMRNPMMASDLDISSMVVGATISTIGVVSVFTLPLLTMRLWAEEKLLGATLFAFGFLCSTWTENQIVACVLAWAGFLFFWLIGSAADFVGPALGKFFAEISFAKHHENFAKGVIEIKDVAYFVLFTVFCLFLTLRSIESTRWRG